MVRGRRVGAAVGWGQAQMAAGGFVMTTLRRDDTTLSLVSTDAVASYTETRETHSAVVFLVETVPSR
jgi:hypothetical protein